MPLSRHACLHCTFPVSSGMLLKEQRPQLRALCGHVQLEACLEVSGHWQACHDGHGPNAYRITCHAGYDVFAPLDADTYVKAASK